MLVELNVDQLVHIRTSLRAEIDANTKGIVDRVGRKEFQSAENLYEKLQELTSTLEIIRGALMGATEGRLNGR